MSAVRPMRARSAIFILSSSRKPVPSRRALRSTIPDFELKPEMYVNVRLEGERGQDVLTVPVEAVITLARKQTVFVGSG